MEHKYNNIQFNASDQRKGQNIQTRTKQLDKYYTILQYIYTGCGLVISIYIIYNNIKLGFQTDRIC